MSTTHHSPPGSDIDSDDESSLSSATIPQNEGEQQKEASGDAVKKGNGEEAVKDGVETQEGNGVKMDEGGTSSSAPEQNATNGGESAADTSNQLAQLDSQKKRGRGRPPKGQSKNSFVPKKSTTPATIKRAMENGTTDEVQESQESAPPKKGRGRPSSKAESKVSKNNVDDGFKPTVEGENPLDSENPNDSQNTSTASKRPRGRPKGSFKQAVFQYKPSSWTVSSGQKLIGTNSPVPAPKPRYQETALTNGTSSAVKNGASTQMAAIKGFNSFAESLKSLPPETKVQLFGHMKKFFADGEDQELTNGVYSVNAISLTYDDSANNTAAFDPYSPRFDDPPANDVPTFSAAELVKKRSTYLHYQNSNDGGSSKRKDIKEELGSPTTSNRAATDNNLITE